jgi:hypothetical protein
MRTLTKQARAKIRRRIWLLECWTNSANSYLSGAFTVDSAKGSLDRIERYQKAHRVLTRRLDADTKNRRRK